MERQSNLQREVDWPVVLTYIAMVVFGWTNIYAAVYDPETQKTIFDLSLNSGKQLLWIATAALLILIVMVIDFKFYETVAYLIYGGMLLLLIATVFLARDINGSRSWLEFGGFRLQPAEFAKFATALGIARFLDDNPNWKADSLKTVMTVGAMLALPAVIIILQKETGSALVYAAFVILLYREGLPGSLMALGILLVMLFIATLFFREWDMLNYLLGGISVLALICMGIIFLMGVRRKGPIITVVLIGWLLAIGIVFGVDGFISKVLLPHQQQRIAVLVDPNVDLMGAGWNITQSKIAIGSGGFWGKGYLKGTQTKFDFVPEQSTDFIFCTVGEEHGFVGSVIVVVLFVVLLSRLVILAERQKSRFARVYGYGVIGIFFFHFMINIGMTIGLFPIIGIPLPFFSYGGSSLWSFTILLFIFLKLDAHRSQILARR